MTKSNAKNIVFVVVLLVGIVFLGGCVGKEAEEKTESLTEILDKAKTIVSYKYDMTITSPGQPVVTAKFWLKEDKIRWEGIVEGQNVVYLIDEDKTIAYLYIPAQNMAMKMNFDKIQESVGESPKEQSESVMQYNPITVGSETLDRKNCLVIEYTAKTGKTKMWLWTKYGIPIKTEITIVKDTTVVEIKNIDFGSISDSMFELPAGVQLMQIPNFSF